MKSPLKWHGGKSYQAKHIISLMPPRCKNPNNPDASDDGWLHYVEPCFGGGAVLLANDPEGISEVANDLNGELINFWHTLQGGSSFSQFRQLASVIPFSEKEFSEAADKIIKNSDGYDESVLGAASFFVRCRQSLSGRMDSFAGISRTRTRQGMNEQVAAWLSCIDGLPAVHARLKRVLIRNQPALDVIRKEDGPRTLFYLDPPYLHEARATTGEYQHEMTGEDHSNLLHALEKIEGRFLLSGYHSPLYDHHAKQLGWKCYEFNIANHASGGKEKRKMVECVWCNF